MTTTEVATHGPASGKPTGALDADEATIERFFAKVDMDSSPKGCWLWTAYCHPDTGSGSFVVAKPRKVAASRWSWEFHNQQEIPPGLEVRKECRTANCVNPEHLRLVSRKQNVAATAEYHDYGRTEREKTHCPKGHEYVGENVRVSQNGWRFCRTCHREQSRAALVDPVQREKINAGQRARRAKKKTMKIEQQTGVS